MRLFPHQNSGGDYSISVSVALLFAGLESVAPARSRRAAFSLRLLSDFGAGRHRHCVIDITAAASCELRSATTLRRDMGYVGETGRKTVPYHCLLMSPAST